MVTGPVGAAACGIGGGILGASAGDAAADAMLGNDGDGLFSGDARDRLSRVSDDLYAVVFGLVFAVMALIIRVICKASDIPAVSNFFMGGSYVLLLLAAALLVSPLFLS